MDTFTIHVAFGQTKVNNVYVVAGGVNAAYQEIIGLNVSVDDAFFVDNFDAVNELLGNDQHSLEVKFALARLEQVF